MTPGAIPQIATGAILLAAFILTARAIIPSIAPVRPRASDVFAVLACAGIGVLLVIASGVLA